LEERPKEILHSWKRKKRGETWQAPCRLTAWVMPYGTALAVPGQA
jgi:hypothetical protein